ncbi:MAG: DmsE family decaheme c-type cytochrome [Betaproteobacteria bacterium]|nr:DmsE family decaheme c-type cytochrome [Betaproteobacteria bacterium]
MNAIFGEKHVATWARGAAIALIGLLGWALPAKAQEATYVGEAKCLSCHDTENQHFRDTQHARAFRGNPKNQREKYVCEACHGPGSKHVSKSSDKTAIISFTKESGTPIQTMNAQCLSCHGGGQRQHWAASTHELNNIACSDCHAPMERRSVNGLLRKPTITETCLTCHQQQRAEFQRRSHMPVLEGKMSCVDCHNPHGSITRPLLKNDSVNETCAACHAEKRGPFIWEHAPVRESCINCHSPHGSNNERLLVSSRPFLCQQCHSPPVGHPGQFFRGDQTAAAALQGGTQSARVIGRSCQNCHVAVHGSNHPSGARLQR